MNVYDQAHTLARALAESDEYRRMLEAKDKLKDDAAALDMIRDFRLKQFEVQAAQMSGETVPAEKQQQLEALYAILEHNADIRAYLVAEQRFGQLLADIQKIIGEAVQECLA